MTHNDIYTKFMIEYDKDVTSSYPSLTHYEVATILDKAYLAIIAQKITGNNPRRVPTEYDTKSIEDLRQLQTSVTLTQVVTQNIASNEYAYELPDNYLYYVESFINLTNNKTALDDKQHIRANVQMLNHELAKNFKASDTNMPWIKNPISYVEGSQIRVLIDSYKYKDYTGDLKLSLTYIKTPNKFTDDSNFESMTEFELNDTIAEELINFAIVIATENTESPRLQTKLSTLQFES